MVKRQPHDCDNLDERIVTIPCKRVHGATQARLCVLSGCSRLRCTVKASNKTRLFCRHEQSFADAVNADDFGETIHLSRMDKKTLPVHRESALFVTRRRFRLLIRPREADALGESSTAIINCER